MSVKQLLDDLDKDNLAEGMSEHDLQTIGEDVCRRFNEDLSSMTDWMAVIDNGLKDIDQDGKPNSEPFDGAANYKSTIVSEAAIKFGDRVKMEVLNNRNLVKGDIIGKDPDNMKQDTLDRVTEYMNFDINHRMVNWRQGQEKIGYRIPLVGSMFKKTVFDPLKGRNASVVIDYPNFAVNQSTEVLEEGRSFTHIMAFDASDVQKRVNAGIWLDANIYGDDPDADKGGNEKEGTTSEENDERFLEQHCFHDINGDGVAEPIIVMVHEKSKKVLRIVANYTEDTVFVKHEGRIETVSKAIRRQQEAHDLINANSANKAQPTEFTPNLDRTTIIDVEPASQITHYGFLPSEDGTFLCDSYFHKVANLQKAHNLSTNQLLDAGTINNLGGGFVSRGFRKKMGVIRTKPSMWQPVDIDPANMRNGILPYPTKEPSQTLFALKENLSAEMRNYTVVTGDDMSKIQGNTAPTTALALLFEQGQATSALLLRFTEAMGSEFRKLFNLSKIYIDPVDYQMVLDDENANYENDFNNELFDIVPVANPEMSSRVQKIQLAMAELEQFDRVLAAGGNPIRLIKNYFEAIGTDDLDQIFPEAGAMTPQEEQQIQAMTEAQNIANEQMRVQIDLLNQQVRNDALEAQSLAVKRDAEIAGIYSQVQERLAKATLLMEQAETEQLANQLTSYTASLQAISDSLGMLQGSNQEAEGNTITYDPRTDTFSGEL